jgi:hypothetical protein
MVKKGSAATATTTPFNNCIIVSKTGALKEIYLIDTELNKDHYKKLCATPPTYEKSFKHQTTWRIKKYSTEVELWARTDGRAGQENKYEFPPPIDEFLFFGDCVLISRAPFSAVLWKKMHAHLFGGFEDLTQLADNDDNEPDELAAISKKKKTRDGYLKDGFIVDTSVASGAATRVLNKLKSKTKLKLPSESNIVVENSGQRINIGFDEIIIDDDGESSSSSSSSGSSGTSVESECRDDDSDENADEDKNDCNSEPGIELGSGERDDDGCDEVDDETTEKPDETENENETAKANDIVVAEIAPAPCPKPKSKKSRGVSANVKPVIKKPAKKRAGLAVVAKINDHDEGSASELDEELYV